MVNGMFGRDKDGLKLLGSLAVFGWYRIAAAAMVVMLAAAGVLND